MHLVRMEIEAREVSSWGYLRLKRESTWNREPQWRIMFGALQSFQDCK